MTASRTTPTLLVLVIITGPSSRPDSSSQAVPVISPLPFSENHPPKHWSRADSPLPRGRTAVTPVRTSSPSMSVTCPTSTPGTSVMAFHRPGDPKSKGMPRSRARGSAAAAGRARPRTSNIGAACRMLTSGREPSTRWDILLLMSWKSGARRDPGGFYRLPADGGEVRIFMTESLFAEAEETLGDQIRNMRRFPGVVDVVITPDAHHGYGVPVGCVIATTGTLAMGPVGYDIGCGMAALRSDVPRERATPEEVKAFSRLVMSRVGLGAGAKGHSFSKERFQEIVRGGAEALGAARGTA